MFTECIRRLKMLRILLREFTNTALHVADDFEPIKCQKLVFPPMLITIVFSGRQAHVKADLLQIRLEKLPMRFRIFIGTRVHTFPQIPRKELHLLQLVYPEFHLFILDFSIWKDICVK